MKILTQEQLLLKAQEQFETMKQAILEFGQQEVRIDQAEEYLFRDLQAIGLTMLESFAAAAGSGDEGPKVTRGERELQRSNELKRRWYRSVFGKLAIFRWVYSRGPNKKIEYAPTDARLGLPKGEYSYLLENWVGQASVKGPFEEAVEGIGAILGLQPSLETAETINQRQAQYAEGFRLQQPPPPRGTQESLLVVTADGTSVPMQTADRTGHPRSSTDAANDPEDNPEKDASSPDMGSSPEVDDSADSEGSRRHGTTRRAYVGGVYSIEPFVRTPQDVLDELSRAEASARRPRPQGKRLWAEMAADYEGSLTSGVERVFVELAIDVAQRDPNRQKTLVALMDGERKLWDLQQEWLGRSVQILDFYHVMKRVRKVSKIVEPGNKSRREAWSSAQVSDLLEGKTATVIRRWQRRLREAQRQGIWTDKQRRAVRSAIGYFKNNADRMCYQEYLASGYPIGSGVAEGGCRNAVKDRLDRTGMHWRFTGAQAMLVTRVLHLNGEWSEFMEYRIQYEQQSLYGTAA